MKTPQLKWDIGTGFDLFVSLDVLHDPATFGLRGQWAAGVRSRLPVDSRDFMQRYFKGQLAAIPWLANQPGPKDSASLLKRIAEIPPAARLSEVHCCSKPEQTRELLSAVQEKGSWSEPDKLLLHELHRKMNRDMGKKKKISDEELVRELDMWAEAEAFGYQWLEAITTYYEVFFAEEEARIRPALEETVERAKGMAAEMPFLALIEELSQGLRFDYLDTDQIPQVNMIPSFWITPLTLFTSVETSQDWLFMFGARPPAASLVPGESVPELLHQALKAMADPTRLRIMRILSDGPSTPTELSRRLRLRPPTVVHHLDALRLARLVQVTISLEGRRYEVRRETIELAFSMMFDFLDRK